jgi:hypothetical protein
MTTPMPPKRFKVSETSRLLDEMRSMRDVLEDIRKDMVLLKYGVMSSDIDVVKAELRLVRSDIADLEKRLPIAEDSKLVA